MVAGSSLQCAQQAVAALKRGVKEAKAAKAKAGYEKHKAAALASKDAFHAGLKEKSAALKGKSFTPAASVAPKQKAAASSSSTPSSATALTADAAVPSLEDFHRRLYCLLSRYDSLGGAGYQAALGPNGFSYLHTFLGVSMECFASPLNCRYCPSLLLSVCPQLTRQPS